MKIFMLFLFIFIPHDYNKALAYENATHLKGAIGLGSSFLRSADSVNESGLSGGFQTFFGYRFKYWEINATSYINASKIKRSKHRVNSLTIEGEASFRSVTFGPTVKYSPPVSLWRNYWRPYISTGPLIGLQTFKFENFTATGRSFDSKWKITYDSFGGIFSIGAEERIEKESYPAFFEISYKYLRSEKASVVGGKPTIVEILDVKDHEQYSIEQTFLFSYGITFF